MKLLRNLYKRIFPDKKKSDHNPLKHEVIRLVGYDAKGDIYATDWEPYTYELEQRYEKVRKRLAETGRFVRLNIEMGKRGKDTRDLYLGLPFNNRATGEPRTQKATTPNT